MLKKSIERVRQVTKTKPRTIAELERDAKQLKRLERLIDVIFAILIWMIFQNLPVPSAEEFEKHSNIEILNAYKNSLIMIFIGMFLIITYWGQNNRVFGNLVRTDGRHAVLSLLQIVFLLLYIYTVGFEMEFPGKPISLIAQSLTLALSGYVGVIAWGYAKKIGGCYQMSSVMKRQTNLKFRFLLNRWQPLLRSRLHFLDLESGIYPGSV